MTHLSIKSFDKIVISHMMLITSENSMFKLKQNHHLLDLNISLFICVHFLVHFLVPHFCEAMGPGQFPCGSGPTECSLLRLQGPQAVPAFC